VEEVFYLFFPLVCRIFGRSKWFLVILLAFAGLGAPGRTLFAHGNEVWSEYCYLGGMEGIALGCLTAILVSRVRFSRLARWVLGILGTATVALSLLFSWQAYRGWLGQTGLNFTVLGLGTCIFIGVTAQTKWRSPRILVPLVRLGEYSYEVYLTHMFVVFGLFGLFLDVGKRMGLVPVLFASTILAAGILGAAVAHFYSEPMNRYLRRKSALIPATPAPVLATEPAPPSGSASV